MPRVRIIAGRHYELMKFARTKKAAGRIADKYRRYGGLARVFKNAVKYKGFPYSIWVRDEYTHVKGSKR